MLTGENGVLKRAGMAKISTDLANYKEELEQWKLSKLMNNENFLEDTLFAGKNNLSYNGQNLDGNIKTIIPDISDEYIDELEIIKGKLTVNTTESSILNAANVAQIESNPYIIIDGELKSTVTNIDLISSNGTLSIPENVTKIGDGAFSGIEGLKKIIIPGTVKTIGANAFAYNQSLEKVVLQDGIETIGEKAFYQCHNLKEMLLPNTVTNIGQFFASDSQIKELTIPSSLKTINNYAFYALTSLENLTISEGIEIIQEDAFENCIKLSVIDLPATINIIKPLAFNGCNNLIQINTHNNKYTYESGMLLTEDKSEILFLSKKFLESTDTLNIPEGIVNLSLRFDDFENIKSVYIPTSLKWMIEGCLPKNIEKIIVSSENKNFYIENNQLYTDTTLLKSYTKKENIAIKEGTTIIGASAFNSEKNAKEITLADSVEKINGYIIDSTCNSQLKRLKIGSKVSDIASQFNYGTFNVKIEIDENNKNYTIINNVLYNYNKTKVICALYQVTGILKIEDTVKEINSYAFYGQSEMEGIIFPQGIEKLNDNIILRCSKIKKINIPSSIKEIDIGAFNETENLSEIVIHKKEGELKGSTWGAPKGDKILKWIG